MRTFFAAFVGVIAAGIVLLMGLWLLAPREWRDGAGALRAAHDERALFERNNQLNALRERRRERLTLLAGAFDPHPNPPAADSELRLFHETQRNVDFRVGAAEQRAVIHLTEPVQIDEWTLLLPGTPVEFIHYDRDNVVTIGHDGARYQVSPEQTDLRWHVATGF